MATLIAATNISSTTIPNQAPVQESGRAVQTVSAPAGTIITMIREASGKFGVDENLALEIARCESTMRQFDKNGNVVRGLVNPKDIGIFQINEDYHLTQSRKLGLDIYTTRGNIEYAMTLIKKSGHAPWSSSEPCWGDHVAMK
ncbi:MAG: hypothetical protein NTY66_01955 [Candidatus Vogelbacteria bacterium]|nr:hypothetical protein [Candidatus Vogelbacteria bacterium]